MANDINESKMFSDEKTSLKETEITGNCPIKFWQKSFSLEMFKGPNILFNELASW